MNRTALAALACAALLLNTAIAAERPAAARARTATAPLPSFDQLDADGDGFLTRAEVSGTVFERQFNAIDTNHDGRLSRQEFMAAMGLKAEGPSTFNRLDANRDGVIDRDEASVDRPLAQRFRDADADGDGVVDRSEFSAFEAVLGADNGVDRR